jgi:hypothetical protein
MRSPDELAREKIDKVVTDCGWILRNRGSVKLSAGRGIAIREGLLTGAEADAFGERLSPLMDELNLPLAA